MRRYGHGLLVAYRLRLLGDSALRKMCIFDFPFDGRTVHAETSFVPGNEILIGTQLLRPYRLEIHFPERTVLLDRVT
jgi:hypothetical protein